MSQTIACPSGVPSWPDVAAWLGSHGFPVQLRMIDGQLAFPDEQPPDWWSELRLGTPLGMVTVRRDSTGVEVVTWGNADASLRQAWNAVALAFATLAGAPWDSKPPLADLPDVLAKSLGR